MKTKKYLLMSVITLAMLAGSALYKSFGVIGASNPASAPPPTYRLTDLGTINQSGNMISQPAGINSAGQVTGWSFSGPAIHAARFTNGLVEDLGTIPGGSISTGVGINDLGQVTGDSQYSENGGPIRHAVLFSNGTATDLGTLPSWGNYSRGNGINGAGQVVGHSGIDLDTSNTHAFIWDAAGGMRDLGTLGGQYAKAFSINNSGVVTGDAQTSIPFQAHHAFIWDAAGGMRDIGTIAGSYSTGAFINNNGHIAGTSSISADNRHHAFLYDGTTMLDLGSLGPNHFFSDRSTGKGVNIHDHVVGSTYRPYEGGGLYQIPFIYRDGEMYDLETLVDASGTGYRLYTATGINDAGEIAVDAIRIGTPNQARAVLLTPNGPWPPTPTPTATPIPSPTPTPCGTPTNFANTTPLSIPILGSATPYPATIAVAALAGNVTKVTVKLNNLSHTYADDVDILLVGPGGQNAIILSDVGGGTQPMNVTLTLDDAAVNNLPDSTSLSSGTFKPTNIGSGDTFPAPAPAPLGGSALSVFNGTNPNGTWSLYVVDDLNSDAGNVAGGWELNITTDDCGSPTPTPTPGQTLPASNFLVVQGRSVVGGLNELTSSDDTYLSILQNPFRARTTPAVQVQFEAVTEESGAGSIEFRVEANTSAVPAGNVTQRIELFNFITQQWTTVSETAAAGSDFVQTGTVAFSASEYLEVGTGRVRSRVSWFDLGTLITRSWRVNIDHVSFTIRP